MQITWHFDLDDTRRVQALIEAHQAAVQERLATNIWDEGPKVDRSEFWKALVAALVTSVQRSGANSPVHRFLNALPFPLTYERLQSGTVHAIATSEIADAGLRFTERLPSFIKTNFDLLEGGLWTPVLEQCRELARKREPEARKKLERQAARALVVLQGIGPKQSRNILQSLGLTRYEIPIDSRVTKWLSATGFPAAFGPAALSDRACYEFVLDGIQQLCEHAGVLPCALDRAIFASFEPGTAPENLLA